MGSGTLALMAMLVLTGRSAWRQRGVGRLGLQRGPVRLTSGTRSATDSIDSERRYGQCRQRTPGTGSCVQRGCRRRRSASIHCSRRSANGQGGTRVMMPVLGVVLRLTNSIPMPLDKLNRKRGQYQGRIHFDVSMYPDEKQYSHTYLHLLDSKTQKTLACIRQKYLGVHSMRT